MIKEHEVLKHIGLQIKILREWAGLKQTELAKKMHISKYIILFLSAVNWRSKVDAICYDFNNSRC